MNEMSIGTWAAVVSAGAAVVSAVVSLVALRKARQSERAIQRHEVRIGGIENRGNMFGGNGGGGGGGPGGGAGGSGGGFNFFPEPGVFRLPGGEGGQAGEGPR